MNNAYVGSSFDDFLEEEGIAEEVKNEAIKRLISYNLLEEMQKQNINKTEMDPLAKVIRTELRKMGIKKAAKVGSPAAATIFSS